MDQKPEIQYVGQFYVYGSEVQAEKKKQQKKRNYRKDKPWDGDHIDHWKIEVRAAFLWVME